VRCGDNWSSALLSKCVSSIRRETSDTQRSFEKQWDSDSCSKWRPRLSPEASQPPDYRASNFGVEWRHGPLSVTQALPNMVISSSSCKRGVRCRNRTSKSCNPLGWVWNKRGTWEVSLRSGCGVGVGDISGDL